MVQVGAREGEAFGVACRGRRGDGFGDEAFRAVERSRVETLTADVPAERGYLHRGGHPCFGKPSAARGAADAEAFLPVSDDAIEGEATGPPRR